MARIVMADGGIAFDGHSLGEGPLGGAETAFVSLAEALAARGHDVAIRNNCARAGVVNGVDWAPLDDGLPETCDMYVANRGDRLLALIPGAARTVFWIHNPARYLLKWRYLSKLMRLRPAIVFSGRYHGDSYPGWAPSGERIEIPYGISEVFRTATPPDAPPGPRAVFTSNPLRSLDWLLELWAVLIRPAVPDECRSWPSMRSMAACWPRWCDVCAMRRVMTHARDRFTSKKSTISSHHASD